MPAATAPATVLVTGANGYVAVWLAQQLLEKGYTVRGTARSTSKGEYLKKKFASYGDKFQFYEIPDVNRPGAYDDVVQGVDLIQSLAAPLPQKIDSPEQITKPAIEGTIALLESARKAGTVKRVVITSTVYTVMEPKEGVYEYSEADWNDAAVRALHENPKGLPGYLVYAASKVLLERACVEYVKTHASEINFDCTYILPPWILGPSAHEVAPQDVSNQFSSIGVQYGGFVNPAGLPDWVLPDVFVDVRDCATAHLLAGEVEEAGNQRIMTVSGPFDWQLAYKALNEAGIVGAPAYDPEFVKNFHQKKTYSNAVSLELFKGFKYRQIPETMTNTWVDLQERGWIDAEGNGTVHST